MTSNLGSSLISEYANDLEKQEQTVQELLNQNFRPEFLNRLDDIIIFQPLTEKEIEQIVVLQLELVRKRLAKKDFTISFDNSLVNYLAKTGYDPVFGARPLKRLIQSSVLDKLSMSIIDGKLKSGQAISVGYKDNQVQIK